MVARHFNPQQGEEGNQIIPVPAWQPAQQNNNVIGWQFIPEQGEEGNRAQRHPQQPFGWRFIPQQEEERNEINPVPARQPPVQQGQANVENNENNNNLLQLIDEAEWFNRYGLRGEPFYGSESYDNRERARQRAEEELKYQEQVHSKIFDEANNGYEKGKQQERIALLKQWEKQVIKLVVGAPNGESLSSEKTTNTIVGTATQLRTIDVNLKDLATHSDIIFSMAVNRQFYRQRDDENSLSLSFLLKDYDEESVKEFLHGLMERPNENEAATADRAALRDVISPDHVVDCCRLAHYLQCRTFLQEIIDTILVPSIDSENCLSICQLADQLNLPILLEASLNHVFRSIGKLQNDELAWNEYLTPELRQVIESIQKILQSSNRKQLYFSNFSEYLALLAEQHQYYKERLEEALYQQDLHEEETRGWKYAQSKIQLQVDRVTTLGLFLEEQKKVFGNCRSDGL